MRVLRLSGGRALLLAALSVAALSGCDPQRIEKLEEGVSTEVEVRRQFGEPATVTIAADGSKLMEYPRQPEGWTNFVIGIGADGKMNSLRQLLTEANFAKVQPGMGQLEVRALLGRPAQMKPYPLKTEEVWDWRFKPQNESRLFSVTFDSAGKVSATGIADDPRESQGGRN